MPLHVSSTCAHHQEVCITQPLVSSHLQVAVWCTRRPPVGVMIPEAVGRLCCAGTRIKPGWNTGQSETASCFRLVLIQRPEWRRHYYYYYYYYFELCRSQTIRKLYDFNGIGNDGRRLITLNTAIPSWMKVSPCWNSGSSVGIATELLAERSGIEFRQGRDFQPVQTGPGAHPASCTMGAGSFPWVKCGRGVLLTTHPLLVPRSWKSRAIPLPTLWATPDL